MSHRARIPESLSSSEHSPITDWWLPPPWVEVDLTGLSRAQQIAYAFVEGVMRKLGLDADTAHNAGWASSELVGNAIRHATRPHRLRLHGTTGKSITVCVTDGLPSPVDIQLHAASPLELGLDDIDALPFDAPEIEHRRGLSTVAAISQGRLGCLIAPGEKGVWFMLPILDSAVLAPQQVESLLKSLDCPPVTWAVSPATAVGLGSRP